MKKIIFCLLFCLYAFYSCCVPINTERAAEYVTQHAESRSHCCCAWYVMRAMQAGGSTIGILPAWAYEYVLPFYGFANITDIVDGHYKKGDIVVFPAVKCHPFGHIAMWNGTQWVSDFKQKSMICAKAYSNARYNIYRNS